LSCSSTSYNESDNDHSDDSTDSEGDESDTTSIDQEEDITELPNYNENEPDFPDDAKIHPELECLTSDALFMCLAYCLRHNLSWKALSDLLFLINCIIGKKNHCQKQSTSFKRFFLPNYVL
jgi:hypothetical protein